MRAHFGGGATEGTGREQSWMRSEREGELEHGQDVPAEIGRVHQQPRGDGVSQETERGVEGAVAKAVALSRQ